MLCAMSWLTDVLRSYYTIQAGEVSLNSQSYGNALWYVG